MEMRKLSDYPLEDLQFMLKGVLTEGKDPELVEMLKTAIAKKGQPIQ